MSLKIISGPNSIDGDEIYIAQDGGSTTVTIKVNSTVIQDFPNASFIDIASDKYEKGYAEIHEVDSSLFVRVMNEDVKSYYAHLNTP